MKKILCFLVSFILILTVLSVSSCAENKTPKGKYDITMKLDGDTVNGELSYTFYGSDEIKFNLYANAYRENAKYFVTESGNLSRVYPDGIDYGGTEIKTVSLNGENASFELIGEDLNILSVKLPSGKEQENTVKIEFETKVPKCKGRLGISDGVVRITDCFPVACAKSVGEYKECEYSPYGDPYYAEVCDYEAEFSVPSEKVLVASSYPISVIQDGEHTTYTYKAENMRDFAFALSEEYKVKTAKSEYADIYYYSKADDETFVNTVKDAIGYFSETFGDFTYKTFSVAETPFFAGGMEYSGMCFIADDLTEEDKRIALIHETAHEWWHSAVGFDETEEAYLDEGLAQYSTYLFLKNNGYKEEAESMLESAKTAYKSFFDIKTLLSGGADTSMKRKLNDFKGEYEYVNIAYNKPLIMFAEYEKAVGESRAIKGLRNFYKNNLYKTASLQELISSLGLEEFFSSYVNGKVII